MRAEELRAGKLRAEELSADELRYEIKMVCEEDARHEVVAAMRLLTAAIRPLHPERVVQSIYFDTHAGRAVEENLAGVSERSKLRLRWYGPEVRGVRARLELKRRRNKLGAKKVFDLPDPLDVEGAPRSSFTRVLGAHCPPEWRELLVHDAEPAQWIRYLREYWITGDRAVRITLDRDLVSFDQRDRSSLSHACPTPRPRLLVVELKAPEQARARLEELVQEMPLVVDRCSKFVLASAPDHGPIVSRFRS